MATRYATVSYTHLDVYKRQRLGVQQGIEALAYQIVLIPVDLSHTVQTDTQYQTVHDALTLSLIHILMAETPQMALQRLIKQHPPLQHLIDSLGLVLVEES